MVSGAFEPYASGDNSDNYNDNNENERCNSRFFTISLHRELSPTHTLKWPVLYTKAQKLKARPRLVPAT